MALQLAKYEGDVYFGFIDPGTGNFMGYLGPYECDTFEPGREAGDTVEIKSKRRNTYGQTIYSETEQGTPSLSIGFREQPVEILALLFASDVTQVTVSASTVTDEEVFIGALNTGYKLAHRNIKVTPAPTVKSQDSTPVTYTAGTDYVIDNRLGFLTIPTGSTIAVGDPVDVSYSYDAFSGQSLDGETVNQREIRVLFDGKNRISQKDFQVEYYDVKVTAPENMIDLLSSELITATIEGTPLTPQGQTKPYQILKEA